MLSKPYPLVTRSLFSILTVVLIGALVAACQPAATVAPTPQPEQPGYAGRKIAFVSSYHEGYAWSDGLEEGLHSVLDDTGANVLFIRMDTKRHTDPAFLEQAGKSALAAIEDFKPDVIITADDNAQKLLVVPYLLDSTTPIVFCGVNWDASKYGFPTSHITGMVEVELVAELIDHLKTFASGARIAYVTTDSETERTIAETYNDRFFDGEMQVYWAKTYDEFTAAFDQAQQEADMVFLGNNAGIDRWDDAEAQQFFIEHTRVPTGAINDWMAPYVLLTLAKSSQEQGEWAAQAALKILDGTPVSDIPVARNQRGDIIANLNIAATLNVAFSPSVLRNAKVIGLEEGSDD